jgi:hypothetical protein
VRSRVAIAVAAGTALLPATLTSAVASAQEGRQELLTGKHRNYESPQHFAFELRFSPWSPNVDSDPGLGRASPYASTFGSGALVFVGAEFDWQALRIPHVGTLGPGAGIGYTKASGNALFAPYNGSPCHEPPEGGPCLTVSGETTSLEIFPMYVVGVFRADALWREAHVPLVPYAKFGLAYAIWRASNSLGTSSANGVTGVGGTFGTQLGLGLGFNLNVFDEYAAKNFDEAMGVNNTYLYAEYTRADLQGLGLQSNPLRVGTQTWTFGLTFEF